MNDDTKEVLRGRVAEVQRRYQRQNPLLRVVWAFVGATIVVIGLLMTVLPGPAIIVLPLGLAILAAQFTWARRLLEVGIDRGVDAKRAVQRATPAAKLLTVLAVTCLVGAVVAFLVLRSP